MCFFSRLWMWILCYYELLELRSMSIMLCWLGPAAKTNDTGVIRRRRKYG